MAYRVKIRCLESNLKISSGEHGEYIYLKKVSFCGCREDGSYFEMEMEGEIEENFEVGKEYYMDFVKVIANPRREKDVEAPRGLTPMENPNF